MTSTSRLAAWHDLSMDYSTVVLLRGINVGGKNRLPMAELRAAIQSVGGGECQTYIQSGNAVCAQPVAPQDLAAEIERRVGFKPAVITLAASDYLAAIENSPFDLTAGDEKDIHIYFAEDPVEYDVDAARELATSTERVAHAGRCVYLFAPDGVGRSKLAAGVERFASSPLTARNGRTVLRIRELLGDAAGDETVRSP